MSSAALKFLLGRSLWICRCGNRCASSSSAAPTARPSFLFGSATTFPPPSFHYYYSSSSLSSCEALHGHSISQEPRPPPTDAAELFRRWGCTDAEATFVLDRQPLLRSMNQNTLDANLQLLGGLGVTGSNLVRVVVSRPSFLTSCLGAEVQNRFDFLRTLFTSDADLLRVIVRNPFVLKYDVERTVRPCVRLYESVGVDALDFGRLLRFRPMIIIRSSLDDEKLELLRRIPRRIPNGREAPMYNYAVAVLAIANLETLQTKIANLERFGIDIDEIMTLFVQSPFVLTLSTEKVQRNMTYIMGTIKIPSNIIVRYPRLLLSNLDTVLRPRHMLCVKLEEMGLQPRMKVKEPASLLRVVLMKESRFLEVFVKSYPEDVSWKLMEYYSSCKSVRRLAESSRIKRKKTNLH